VGVCDETGRLRYYSVAVADAVPSRMGEREYCAGELRIAVKRELVCVCVCALTGIISTSPYSVDISVLWISL
jgi:hypothetical protein